MTATQAWTRDTIVPTAWTVPLPTAALAKRLGFRLEGGPIRDRWSVNGKWHSVMLYGLIAGEER